MAEKGGPCKLQSAHSHFSPRFSQSLTECLVDDSEQRFLEDRKTAGTVIWDDWREVAFGWQQVVAYPKYATQRHRPPRPQRSDLAARKGAIKTQAEFHCLTDADNSFYPWKESVEPGTYSYLPNNGFYRNSKPGPTKLSREVQEWLEAMQRSSQSAKSMLAKQLRRAAEIAQQKSESGTYVTESSAAEDGMLPSTTNPSPVKKFHRAAVARGVAKQDRTTTEILQFAARRLQSQAQQLNSSSGDRSVKTHYLHFTGSQAECSHATTCHSGVSRKSGCELSLNIAEGRCPLTDAYMPNTTRLAIQTKNHQRFEEDLFTTFIPVCKQENLRPLMKLTPKQKETEDKGSRAEKGLPLQSDSEAGRKDGSSLHQDTAIPLTPATATVFPPDESCGIRTARSAIAKTNLRIEEMRNSPLRSSQPGGKASRSFFAHKGSGLALLKNGVLRYTVTK